MSKKDSVLQYLNKFQAQVELKGLCRPLFVVVRQLGVMWLSTPDRPISYRKRILTCKTTLQNFGRGLIVKIKIVLNCYFGWPDNLSFAVTEQ